MWETYDLIKRKIKEGGGSTVNRGDTAEGFREDGEETAMPRGELGRAERCKLRLDQGSP